MNGTTMKTVPTVVRAADLAAYAPANHTGTSNVRVIGPETVGATALEVLVGTIVKSQGAKPHAHPHLEQCAYMIEGTGESQAQGRVEAMGPGTWTYVPAGVFHSFRVTSDQPGRLLVVYAPPYGENPTHTITEPDPAVAARGEVRVLAAAEAATPTVALIDRGSVGAQWVEIEALRMGAGSALSCPARPDAEQVLYLEDGQIDACVGEQDFQLAAGDFLFLPRAAAAALRCPTGRRAAGFLIKGRLPSSPSH
jgi:quercetin dioxygenase-like cupin family protein